MREVHKRLELVFVHWPKAQRNDKEKHRQVKSYMVPDTEREKEPGYWLASPVASVSLLARLCTSSVVVNVGSHVHCDYSRRSVTTRVAAVTPVRCGRGSARKQQDLGLWRAGHTYSLHTNRDIGYSRLICSNMSSSDFIGLVFQYALHAA